MSARHDRAPWLAPEIELVADWHALGFSAHFLAETLGRTVDAVKKVMRDNGITERQVKPGFGEDYSEAAVRAASRKLAERGHPALMPNLVARARCAQPSRPTALVVSSLPANLANGVSAPFVLLEQRAP